MKKVIVLLGVFLFAGYSLADGAFGVYKGMTKEDLEKKGVTLKRVGDNQFLYSSLDAPVKNNYFSSYQYSFNKANKVCDISAWSKPLKTDDYGSEIKKEMYEIKTILDKKYGKAEIIDNLKKYPPERFVFYLKKLMSDGTMTYVFFWNNNKIMLLPILNNANNAEIILSYSTDDCGNSSNSITAKGL